jgi:NNP family nitrate/nitrite transporter-like MFS transporter
MRSLRHGAFAVKLLVTGLFIEMSNGVTYSVVPFVNQRALVAVAGIVGAGGNVGTVLAGFLFRTKSLTWPQALWILGILVFATSSLALLVRFSVHDEVWARDEMGSRLDARMVSAGAPAGD